MAWVAVDKNKQEFIYEDAPIREVYEWVCNGSNLYCNIPKGTIKKLIGRELTWEDEPVELKEEQV